MGLKPAISITAEREFGEGKQLDIYFTNEKDTKSNQYI